MKILDIKSKLEDIKRNMDADHLNNQRSPLDDYRVFTMSNSNTTNSIAFPPSNTQSNNNFLSDVNSLQMLP